MTRQESRPIPNDLNEVREQFEQWRCTRQGRGRIPEALWTSAVSVVSKYGLCRTAKVLGLNVASLKKRLGSAVDRQRASPRPASFVELVSPVSSREYSIELEDACGSKMRIVMKNDGALDVGTLIDRFWEVGG